MELPQPAASHVRSIPLPLVVLLSAVATACAHPLFAADPAPTPAPAGVGIESVPGLRAPQEGLLTAAQPRVEAWKALAQQGVVAVVNLRPDDEQPGRDERTEVAGAGMAYHHVPIAGAEDLTPANAARLWALVGGAPGKVLVHCASGNRAGALLALGAANSGEMTPEQALAFGRSAGLASPRLEAVVRERLGLPASGE